MTYSVSSGRLDSNQRPLAPHASALPGCATSRKPAARVGGGGFVGCKGKEKGGICGYFALTFFWRGFCKYLA